MSSSVDTTSSNITSLDSSLNAYKKIKKDNEEKAEKTRQENSVWTFTGIDTNNFSSTKKNNNGQTVDKTTTETIGDCLSGGVSLALSPATVVFNGVGSFFGADTSLTDSSDGESSYAGKGFLSSIGTCFKGLGNFAKGILGGNSALQKNQTGKQTANGSGSTGNQGTATTDAEKLAQIRNILDGKSAATGTGSSGGSSSTGAGSASGSGSSGSASGSSTSTKASTSNATLGSLTRTTTEGGKTAYKTNGGNLLDIDTGGYEKSSEEVRSAVEEYDEAATELSEAETAETNAQKKYDEAAKKITGQNEQKQKQYADAQGEYNGHIAQLKNLNTKLDSITRDINSAKKLISEYKGKKDETSQTMLAQAESSLKNLETERDTVEKEKSETEKKRDKAEATMNSLKDQISENNETKALASAKAELTEAQDRKTIAQKLVTQNRSAVQTAVNNASAKNADGTTKAGSQACVDAMKRNVAILDEEEAKAENGFTSIHGTTRKQNDALEDTLKDDKTALDDTTIANLKKNYVGPGKLTEADFESAIRVAKEAKAIKTAQGATGGGDPSDTSDSYFAAKTGTIQ